MKARPPRMLDARKTRRVLSFNRPSALAGRLADLPLPKPLLNAAIRAYAKAFAVNLDEARRPIGEYRSMGDFFTRELRDGVRTVHPGSDLLTSPADGHLHNYGPVTDGCIPQVKGHDYSVAELLHDDAMAARFDQGTFATIYLSPRDYHRVHSPLAGQVTQASYIPGALYSVSPFMVNNLAHIFTTNERIPVYLETDHGLVAVVLVGATIVGRITLTFSHLTTNNPRNPEETAHFEPPVPIRKGDELGAFCLGSTVVLLMEKEWKPQMLAEGMPVRMGAPLFKI